jgi:hypothetical protein
LPAVAALNIALHQSGPPSPGGFGLGYKNYEIRDLMFKRQNELRRGSEQGRLG